MKVLVIGKPIKHSLSPLIHNFWMKKYNLDILKNGSRRVGFVINNR